MLAIGDVFQFYSAQLQSHAATAASFAVVFLALLTIKPAGVILTILWLFGVVTVVTGISFTLLRLFIYGAHSSTILWSTWSDVSKFEKQMVGMLPQTQVGYYANWYFINRILKEKRFRVPLCWIFNDKAHPRKSALAILWFALFGAATILVFVSPYFP